MTTGVSLFSGVGGFDIAMERAGIKVTTTVEIDKNCQTVLKERFPNTQILGDITQVKGSELIDAGFNPRTGIITGGFPCQDLSVAGKRAGLEGKRSGLFWEICRLLTETKAQNFILENVPGLLSSNEGKDMATVVEALVELGYGIAWRVLDAQHFGVPQRRRRVFIVGCLGDSGRTPAEVLAIAESRSRYLATGGKSRKTTTKDINGISNTVGSLLARDHKGLDQISVEENKVVVFYGNRINDIRIQDGKINTLQARMGTGGNNTPIIHTEASIRRLTPLECERLQGFPDGWTEGQPNGHRYKQMGNAVAVPVVEWVVNRLQATLNSK
jgi:DNA (cytosine-5)-methyltransferase 1